MASLSRYDFLCDAEVSFFTAIQRYLPRDPELYQQCLTVYPDPTANLQALLRELNRQQVLVFPIRR